jgi:hypothetical protein
MRIISLIQTNLLVGLSFAFPRPLYNRAGALNRES